MALYPRVERERLGSHELVSRRAKQKPPGQEAGFRIAAEEIRLQREHRRFASGDKP
jgi:hypothetical protein